MTQRARTRTGIDSGWTFLTNHAHVLLCIAEAPGVRLRDVAGKVGITERAVQRIVAELDESGYLYKVRDGRRNRYEVCGQMPLRHPIENHCTVAALIEVAASHEVKPAKRAAAQASKRSRGRSASEGSSNRSSNSKSA